MQRKTEYLLFRWLSPHHFVTFTIVWLALGCIIAYGISVSTGKVAAIFPYISDAGATPPASCVFGLLLNIAGVFGIISVYIRHGDVERSNLLEHHKVQIINDISMFIGVLACVGLILVACFQSTQVLAVHMLGAAMLFFGGVVYCYLQSCLSYMGIGRTSTNLKTIVRFGISMVATLALIYTIVFGAIATTKSNRMAKDKLQWKVGEPGYYAHVVSAFSEWITASCLLLFFLTFYHEFKNIQSTLEIKSKLNVDMIEEDRPYEVLA